MKKPRKKYAGMVFMGERNSAHHLFDAFLPEELCTKAQSLIASPRLHVKGRARLNKRWRLQVFQAMVFLFFLPRGGIDTIEAAQLHQSALQHNIGTMPWPWTNHSKMSLEGWSLSN